MPLWQIYCPPDAYTDEDKRDIAGAITAMYESFLPRFYVNVLFHALPKSDFFVGGEPTGDFVRLTVDHIARSLEDPTHQKIFVDRCIDVLAPYVANRGFRWELHVDNTPIGLWTINGLRPPRPGTDAEIRWRSENRPTPYEIADLGVD